MAVAHDAATEFATFTTTSPASDTHTPVADPQGVIVEIDHGTTSNDLITGVTYGGVAMERVAAVPFAAVPCRVYLYFLGSGIPTGAQTVAIAHTGTTDVKHATVATVTAAGDTEIGGTGGLAQAIPSPRVEVHRGPLSGLTYGVLYSQALDPADLALLAGMTAISDHDFGSESSRFDRETTADDEEFTFGYTDATSTGNTIAAVSIQEQQPGVYAKGGLTPPPGAPTTTFTIQLVGQLDGIDLYLGVTSRDHTSGTALPTVTDDGGGNTWDLITNSTDRKATLWHKKGVAADVGALLTVAGGVNSTTGGILMVKGGAAGDPTTNLVLEDNASGDETHAGFTPDNDGSAVTLFVFGVTGIGPITSATAATMGTLEPEFVEKSNPGGSDSEIWFSARTLASGATGDFTWARVNAATKSVSFAVAPPPPPDTRHIASRLTSARLVSVREFGPEFEG